jgi:hypothetical protein
MTDVSEEFTASIFMMLTHHSDDGGRKLLWNISQYLLDWTMQHSRRQPYSYLSPWEPQISTSLIQFTSPHPIFKIHFNIILQSAT